MGKVQKIENVCLFIENNDYSYRKMRVISKWLERSKKIYGSHVEEFDEKRGS